MSLALLGTMIAVLGFALSAVNAWLTWWRRGTVRMVRPSLVAFLDARGTDGPKVWFRSLLYSTAQKGNVLESMYVRLHRGEMRQNFSFWVCGERGKLASGCGLFVGQGGVALDHHFVLPKDGGRFEFLPGEYVVEVFGTLVGSQSPLVLARIPLHLSAEHAKALKDPAENVYFDWWPDSQRYNPHVVRKADPPMLPAEIFEGIFGPLSSPRE